jgi:hypothetical protein
VPIALLDLCVMAYQAVCFRVWGVWRVKQSSYILIDRQGLAYLNAIEKLNCFYCGYANGVIAFAREVAGRTAQYWRPINQHGPLAARSLSRFCRVWRCQGMESSARRASAKDRLSGVSDRIDRVQSSLPPRGRERVGRRRATQLWLSSIFIYDALRRLAGSDPRTALLRCARCPRGSACRRGVSAH